MALASAFAAQLAPLDDTENLICATLRGETPRWNRDADAASVARFLGSARYHGVLPLLSFRYRKGRFEDWPETVLAACGEAAHNQGLQELAHRAAVMRVVDALSGAGVKPLVLKGSALAYTLYSNPMLRPRSDTDLLIPPHSRSQAEGVLSELGYVKHEAMEGEFISYQASWTLADVFGAKHDVDLHWRINNSHILAKAANYDELAARAVPVQALGPDAFTLCPVDALLLACIHRAGHVNAPYCVDGVPHYGIDRLIWLYDIHLLISTMSDPDLDEFVALATAKRVKTVCSDGLSSTRACLGTPIAPRLFDALENAGATEPSAHYLAGNRACLMFEDFLALDHWSERMGWARELAFPPARYMRARYAEAPVRWLPALYLRRGLTGISRLITRRAVGSAH